MSMRIAPVVLDERTVAAAAGLRHTPETDPRTRRFGYAPGAYLMEMEPLFTGRSERLIPQGIPVRFETSKRMEDNPNIDKPNWTPKWVVEYTALDYITNVEERFHKPGLVDFGFRSLTPFTVLSDADAALCFAIIHPEFDEVGIKCPADLKVCPTCRINWFESEEFKDRVAGAVAEGLADQKTLDALTEILGEANLAYQLFCKERWSEIESEYDARQSGADSKGLPSLKGGEHHFRRCLHAANPAERQAQVAGAYGEASAKQFADAMKQQTEAMERQSEQMLQVLERIGGSGNDAKVAALETELAAMRAQQEENNRTFQEFIAAQKASAETPIVPTEEVVVLPAAEDGANGKGRGKK